MTLAKGTHPKPQQLGKLKQEELLHLGVESQPWHCTEISFLKNKIKYMTQQFYSWVYPQKLKARIERLFVYQF